jgi:hypothetical protein
MEQKYAKELWIGIAQHPFFSFLEFPYSKEITDLLLTTDIQTGSFYHETASNEFSIELPDFERNYLLSPLGIFENNLAGDFLEKGYMDKIYSIVRYGLNSTSPRYFPENVKRERDLLALMAESSKPYTLLAKVEILDYNECDSRESPIIIVPDAKDTAPVREWEKNHTRKNTDLIAAYIRLMHSANPFMYFFKGID